MGRRKRNRWASYSIGPYNLGQLNGRAIAFWYEADGIRKKRRLDAHTEKQGRSALDQFVRERQSQLKKTSLTCGELFEQYLADREQDGKQVRNLLNSWKALAPRFIKVEVSELHADICRDYARERFDLDMKPATVWTELLMLRTMINWGVKHKLYTEEHKPYIWLPSKGNPRKRVMDESEIQRFVNHAKHPHLKLFFIIALATGARSTAILELTWDRVDFEKGEIDFMKPEAIDPMQKLVRKNRAVVGMDMVVRVALMEAYEANTSDYVIEWNSKPIKRISKAFRQCCVDAGLEGIHPHIIRHSCATFGLERGVPIEVVSKLLGHSDPSITYQIYAHATPKMLAQATNHIDGLIDDGRLIEMQETNFIEYIVMKYGIDKNDAEKLREMGGLGQQLTYFDVTPNKKPEARKL
jgi:integrase